MKLYFKLVLLLLLPAALFGQSTVTLKKQADIVAKAMVNGDYVTVVEYMHPKVIQSAGGKQKMLQMMNAGMEQMKAQGISIQSATVGEPGKFYKAGTEIHCLIPNNIRIKTPNSSIVTHSNLLAISQDGGKNWTFLDLNKGTIASIPKLFPNFNKDLKIPEPTMPSM
jgi:hypothetical protein